METQELQILAEAALEQMLELMRVVIRLLVTLERRGVPPRSASPA